MSSLDGVTDFLIKGTPNQAKPTKIANGQRGGSLGARMSRYEELVVQNIFGNKSDVALADEGSYFVACTATPGTGLVGTAAQSTLVDTAPTILVTNGEAAGGKRLYLDSLKLQVVTAGANGTNLFIAIKRGTAANHYTSGGTVFTPVNVNGDDGTSTLSTVAFGAIVAAADSSSKLLWHQKLRSVIEVAADTYIFEFGGTALAQAGRAADSGVEAVSFKVPPVILGPGQWAAVHLYAASQDTAAYHDFALGFYER